MPQYWASCTEEPGLPNTLSNCLGPELVQPQALLQADMAISPPGNLEKRKSGSTKAESPGLCQHCEMMGQVPPRRPPPSAPPAAGLDG